MVGQLVLLGLLFVAGLPGFGQLVPHLLTDWALLAIGAALMLIGGVAVMAGLRDLGPSLTPMPRPRVGATLVEDGVYAVIRHPIYAGLISGGLGWSAVTRSLPATAVALLLGIYFDLKSRREEAWLADHYPGYDAYRRRTRRFVPWIY